MIAATVVVVGGAARLAARSAARSLRSADDPLGPVSQDPDIARDIACDLTASDQTCAIPADQPIEFDPPTESFDTGAGAGFPALGTLLVIVLVAALVAALVWIVITVIRERRATDDDVDDDDLDEDIDDERGAARIIDVERPPDRWRREAAQHRDAGRYRDAVRCHYRALVGDLARAGVVDEIPGRTSGEERAQLAQLAPDASSAFAAAADIFDEAWFNDEPVSRADDEAFQDAERTVLDHVLVGAGRNARRAHAEQA